MRYIASSLSIDKAAASLLITATQLGYGKAITRIIAPSSVSDGSSGIDAVVRWSLDQPGLWLGGFVFTNEMSGWV
ncbi:hypothetical protein GCM10028773_00550 [Spirosoma koreense]